MEFCCHVWAGAPSCYLELLDKLQKRIYRTVGPSLAASLEPLAHHQNGSSLSLFYRYFYIDIVQKGLKCTLVSSANLLLKVVPTAAGQYL